MSVIARFVLVVAYPLLLIERVYHERLASDPDRVKLIVFHPVMLSPLVGKLPVTIGFVISRVKVIPVELPKISFAKNL